jgi:hypothetical protein
MHHLLHLLLAILAFGSALQLQSAGLHPDDEVLLGTEGDYPPARNPGYTVGVLAWTRSQLGMDSPEGLRTILEALLRHEQVPADERAVNLAVLGRVLGLHGRRLDAEAGWLRELLALHVALQDVEAVRAILEHCHQPALLEHCCRANVRTRNSAQIRTLVRRWALLVPAAELQDTSSPADDPLGWKHWMSLSDSRFEEYARRWERWMRLWDLPPNPGYEEYARRTLRWVRERLQGASPEAGLRETVQALLLDDISPAAKRAVDMAVLDAVLHGYRQLLDCGAGWFQAALARRIAAQDADALLVVLEHCHEPGLLKHCLAMARQGSPQIAALVQRWLAGPASAAFPPAGPRLHVFRLGADGRFDQAHVGLAEFDIRSNPASGYFHVQDARRIVMGMVLPALNPAILDANLLSGSLDDLLQGGLFTAASKGMVLWYDRPTNRAILRRIKNTHDATAPALGVFHLEGRAVSFSQLEPSMAVMASTLSAGKHVPEAAFPMAAGYVVMAFPQAAMQAYELYELNALLDSFEAGVAQDRIAGIMEEGLRGARMYVPQGALHAAYLH